MDAPTSFDFHKDQVTLLAVGTAPYVTDDLAAARALRHYVFSTSTPEVPVYDH